MSGKGIDRERLPLPEAIHGKPWQVHASAFGVVETNNPKREMQVPIGPVCSCGEDHDRAIRQHELMKVRYGAAKGTPFMAAKHDVSAIAWAAAESAFLEHEARHRYKEDHDQPLCQQTVREEIARAIDTRDIPTLVSAMAYVGAWGTHETMFPTNTHDGEMCASAAQLIGWFIANYTPSPKRVAELATWLDQMIGELGEAVGGKGGKGKGLPLGKAPKLVKPGPGGSSSYKPLGEALRSVLSGGIGSSGYRAYDRSQWSAMQMLEPIRPITLPVMKGGRRYRAQEEGTRIRNISRYLVDGKVFARKRRFAGGTLLVDISGSMSFDGADLERVLALAPAATVAMYAGSHSKRAYHITVAARGRRMTSEDIERHIAMGGGGNEVDYPALMWLGKQKEPRIWLSDGEVCAARIDDMDAAKRDCSTTCRKHNIRRVRFIDDVLDAFLYERVGIRSAQSDGYWDTHPMERR